MPLEDLHAELSFREGHLHAERRLRDIARLGGAAEPVMLGDGHDVFQLSQGNIESRHRKILSR
jgi:hypothetical protein